MDGTVYLGDELLPGALRFFEVIRRQRRSYLFLTNNSSRSGEIYARKLNRLGLAVGEDHVFTSGQATALYLKRLKPRARVYLVGTPALEAEFAAQGFLLTAENPDYAVLGFDTWVTYEKLWKLCDFVRAGLPYVATHPDLNCPTPKGFMPDIGAMIAFVRASTGRDPKVIGKPNREMVQAVVQRTGVAEESLCMIGDRLYTDIAMGEASGITTVLVLTGETQPDDVASSPHQPDYVYPDLDAVASVLEKF
jgi:4-nitrophenyl phosphatase/NagD protein